VADLPKVSPQRPTRRPETAIETPKPALAVDPDLAAIRAMLTAAPLPDPDPAPAPQRRSETLTRPQPATRRAWRLPAPFWRGLDWLIVRVLAGTVLAFATPVGYVRALIRHLDGKDLRETIADCLHPRLN
jgi:hypothetical protein